MGAKLDWKFATLFSVLPAEYGTSESARVCQLTTSHDLPSFYLKVVMTILKTFMVCLRYYSQNLIPSIKQGLMWQADTYNVYYFK
jgi:hypothetical protein